MATWYLSSIYHISNHDPAIVRGPDSASRNEPTVTSNSVRFFRLVDEIVYNDTSDVTEDASLESARGCYEAAVTKSTRTARASELVGFPFEHAQGGWIILSAYCVLRMRCRAAGWDGFERDTSGRTVQIDRDSRRYTTRVDISAAHYKISCQWLQLFDFSCTMQSSRVRALF